MSKLPGEIIADLNASGLPWELRAGSRHWHVIIDRQLVTIWPYGHGRRRGTLNCQMQIKRFLRDIHGKNAERS